MAKRWQSRLYLPDTLYVQSADPGSLLHPRCHVCTTEMRQRWAVDAYDVADHGKTPGGTDYTDIRARCRHGDPSGSVDEDVIRIEGMRWTHAGEYAQRLAAVAALSFFTPGNAIHVIPAKLYRAFLGAH